MALFCFAKPSQASEIYHSVPDGAAYGDVIAYGGGYAKVSSLRYLDIYLGDGAADWTAKNTTLEEIFVGQDGVSYSTAFAQGGTNGMKGHLMHANGMSAHVKLVPSGDGTVYIAANYGATKPIWAAKVPNNSVSSLNMADMTPYLIPGFSEAIATDTGIVMTKAMYINDAGTGLQESTATTDTYAAIPLQVEAGYTYYFWASGSKIMLCGINAEGIAAKQIECPTNADLAGYYTQGQLCVAVYFSETVCNDVLFVGTYNNWSTTPSECAKFQPLVGFDDWYVVAVTDNSTNIEGKPVQLASNGSFSWNYQTGDVDSWTLVSGYVSITSAYSGESNLTHYDTSTPVILISDYFKNHNSPCGDVQHTYTVNLKAPICGNFTPAIIGDFNLWATGVAMTYNAATGTYSHTFTGNEGETFKFLAYGYDDWSNELLIYQDGFWITNPNITLTDQLTYTIDYSEGKYALCEDETYSFTYVIGFGEEAILTGYTGTLPEAIEIPATITIDGIVYDVTSIGDDAFMGCSSLTSVTIPNSITRIEGGAFAGCSSLTSITIPNSVTSIGDRAFRGCSSLTSVTIGNSVTSIGEEAFSYCSALTSIVIESGNTIYDSRENCNAIIETATNTLIAGCQSTTIPNSVTSIGEEAFSYCSALTFITIPNSVTSIGEWAFGGCTSLTSITIPNSVTSIGEGAFGGCTSLTSITIPNSVTSIGDYVFAGCSSLTSIVVESGNTVYDSRNNCNAIIETATNTLITGCQSTTIPNSVTSIGEGAFGECTSLTSITIGNSVEYIGKKAFYECSALTSITIPNSLTSIAYATFSSCTALASVTIPSSVTFIEEYAFEECRKLRDIYCYAATPPTAQTNSFANYNVYVHVPCASLDAYDMDAVFGSFKYVECIGSEDADITDKTVTIVPGNADATFTWPITDGAETYTLVITKDGVTFCTLVFNKQGQLVSIAFKPARQNAPATEGTTPANYAEQTANGFRFTVIGLNEGTAYAYTFTVRDAANSVLETYTGEFTTQSDNPMGIQSAGDNTPAGQAEKLLRNGQVLILRNGVTYDMMGQRL